MDAKIDIYTLLFLVLAVVIFLRLRSVLGRRTGSERPPYDPYSASDTDKADGGQDKVVDLPRRGGGDDGAATAGMNDDAEVAARIREYAADNTELANGLANVSRADARFEPGEFLQGAKAAYEMIVTAFAESNKRMLKDLLDRDVYEGFSAAIADRESRGEIVDQSFVGIEKANIVEAELKGRSANVTVKFVSELISATHDRAGEIISGDPKHIKEVTDIWTFARDVSSRNPNWKLIATQAAN